MSERIKGNEPAFPTLHIPDQSPPAWSGMSIRVWLTGQALAANADSDLDADVIAEECVKIADAVIAELNKTA